MSEDIQESLEPFFLNIEIEVKYNDIIKKSVTFEYKWNNNWTFSANIEQIKYTINKYFKLYLESEVNNENN